MNFCLLHHFTTTWSFRLGLLTHLLKAWEKSLEEVFTRVGHGQGTKLRHDDAVLLTVLPVGVALQEPAHVGHISPLDLELVHQGHPVKPVVVAAVRRRHSDFLIGVMLEEHWVFQTHCVLPNSNFPGPLRRKFPLIQEGMVPCTVVLIGSGVSSTERTRGAMVSSPKSGFIKRSLTKPPLAIRRKKKTKSWKQLHVRKHCKLRSTKQKCIKEGKCFLSSASILFTEVWNFMS